MKYILALIAACTLAACSSATSPKFNCVEGTVGSFTSIGCSVGGYGIQCGVGALPTAAATATPVPVATP